MTREEIIRMAREAGFHAWYSDPEREYHFGCIERFAALVAAAEREACATVCEGRLFGAMPHGEREIWRIAQRQFSESIRALIKESKK